ncbi:Pentatricopeptide repeat-containing -like protein [Gossypium arboreum]|uniref:Pentatricopeptide repeat-containing-like protein n=1 Tax=Gossypium arboreum TaxID=29729 RepID=A0A0B0NUX8_GOSAR|nr:Pentatricopeptide repeat-containing -like protein [Gossypium arboreum]
MRERNPVTWACLILGYNQNGMPNNAREVCEEIISMGV